MLDRTRKLPDSELEVMMAVWDCEPPVTRRQIEEIIHRQHPAAQTTILTLLTRLEGKKYIRIDKPGRSSVYTPLISKQDYLASQSRSFIEQLFGGSMPAFAAALCDSGLSKEELDELRKLLDQGDV